MKLADSPTLRVVIYEGPGARPWDALRRVDVMSRLLESGYCISRTKKDVSQETSSETGGAIAVLGMFDQAPPEPTQDPQAGVWVFFADVTEMDGAQALTAVNTLRDQSVGQPKKFWKPWFPVIDYDRCTNCMQCLSFCLFDVYGVSGEKKIQVQNQNNCKTDCPACSRVCPEVAIMFPKYGGGPINGDQVTAENTQRQTMKVDISALLGGDIYSALRQRSDDAKQRFTKERDEKKALQERQRCLIKLGQALDIPAEVLAALPSADQIRAKAQAAMDSPGL